jgi:hypothetical protein
LPSDKTRGRQRQDVRRSAKRKGKILSQNVNSKEDEKQREKENSYRRMIHDQVRFATTINAIELK